MCYKKGIYYISVNIKVKRFDVLWRLLVYVKVSFFYSIEEDMFCFILLYCEPGVLNTMFFGQCVIPSRVTISRSLSCDTPFGVSYNVMGPQVTAHNALQHKY